MIRENFVKTLEKSIRKHWNLPALSNFNGSTFTYGEVGVQILKRHKVFSELGVNPGDKVALIGKNSAQWGISYLSVITYGATVVPILADFHSDSVVNIVNHSDSVLLFSNESILANLDTKKFLNLKGIIGVDETKVLWTPDETQKPMVQQKLDQSFKFFEDQYISETSFEFPEVSNQHIGVISYTSGTTGFSKGVMLPLQSLMANVHYAWNNMPLERGDQLLSVLPLAHAYGCAFEFLWPFTIGVHITFLGKIGSPQIMIEAYQKVKPRLLLMVPLIIEKIYKKKILPQLNDPKVAFLLQVPIVNSLIYRKMNKALTEVFGGSFREVVIGGAALNRDVELFLRKIKFNFSVGYGMTECGPLISYANWDRAKLSSCGKLVDSLEMRIDSPDPENIPGEILVKGENVMAGYYKNPTDTQKVLDEQGWLHTGDLGIMNEEGFVYIKGRSKSMILGPSGENIYPEEIESKLSNYPYIQEQLVISENNRLVALVFPDNEKIQIDGLNQVEVESIMENTKRLVNQSLPKYAQLSEIKLQNKEFDKTPKQSIQRFKYESSNN